MRRRRISTLPYSLAAIGIGILSFYTLHLSSLGPAIDDSVSSTPTLASTHPTDHYYNHGILEAPRRRSNDHVATSTWNHNSPPSKTHDISSSLTSKPQNISSSLTSKHQNISSSLPAPPTNTNPVPLSHEDTFYVTVSYGESLSSILSKSDIPRSDIHNMVKALQELFNPRHLRSGDTIHIIAGTDKKPQIEISRNDKGRAVGVRWENNGFTSYERLRDISQTLFRSEGYITSNLAQAALSQGIPSDVIEEMRDAFSHTINFQRDIRSGDRFRLIYEALYDTSEKRYLRGKVLFAQMDVGPKKQRHSVFRFKPSKQEKEVFFDADGVRHNKDFFLSPVPHARISSHYGVRRDPIVGYNRMHYGVDFVSPKGTAVLAAADGQIAKIGRYGNYGKYISIRHGSAYKTAYAHLNDYASGLGKGSNVKQGQIIGYVGSTGRSTGHHLHFEVHHHNKRINPLKFKIPASKKLNTTQMAAFKAVKNDLLARYHNLKSPPTAVGGN